MSSITQAFPCIMQRFLKAVKMIIFLIKTSNILLFFAQNIDCGYTLEPPQLDGSNEYPQSMLLSKNKKKMYTPVNPNFTI